MSLLSNSNCFTYQIGKSLKVDNTSNDQTNTITLFQPIMDVIEQVSYFKELLNKATLKCISTINSDSDKQNTQTSHQNKSTIEELESLCSIASTHMEGKWGEYLNKFFEFMCVKLDSSQKGICLIGDFSKNKPDESARVMASGYKNMLTLDELEDIAIKYSARFFLSKKLFPR